VNNITLKQWLQQKPYTLSLSSGFFSFFCHCGVLSVLEEQQLLPHRLTGSSAGALIATCWAAGMDCQTISQRLFSLDKRDFWDPGIGLGLLKGQKFRSLIADMLPVATFEECRLPLSLSVYNGLSRKTEVIFSGDIVSAVYASCAVPFLFQPIWMKGKPYWDGGIKDRPALASVNVGERVLYHHIPSRSPWRSKNSVALKLPSQDNLLSLQLFKIPRSGPNKLELGRDIFQLARQKMTKALSSSINNSVVSV